MKPYYLILVIVLLAGCAVMMPTSHEYQKGGPTWESFAHAEEQFALINPGETTTDDLTFIIGQPLDKATGVEKLGVTEILEIYQPVDGITLPSTVTRCMEQEKRCYGYRIRKEVTSRKGKGSLLLRMTNFQRTDEITGWYVTFFLLIEGDVVIDKRYLDGTQNRRTIQKSRDPLGFIRSLIPFL